MIIQDLINKEVKPIDYGKVAVLMGGPYSEREISLMSGNAVLKALTDAGIHAYGIDMDDSLCQRLIHDRPNRVFLAMHGTFGEDGTIQGLLEVLKIPYTGSDVLSSAVAMDKEKTKLIWQSMGLPTLDFIIADENYSFNEAKNRFGLPLCVKPTAEGSSVGVSCVEDEATFKIAFAQASECNCKVMIEPWLEGDELTVSIVADTAMPVIRIVTPVGFYDYKAKYFSEDTQYHIPSGLCAEDEQAIKSLGLWAYKILGCRHWGRADLLLDKQGKAWLLEVNTIPGLTRHSLVPQAAQAMGIDFQTLILTILKQTLTATF